MIISEDSKGDRGGFQKKIKVVVFKLSLDGFGLGDFCVGCI